MWRNWQDDSRNGPDAGGTCLKSESSGGRGRQMSVSSVANLIYKSSPGQPGFCYTKDPVSKANKPKVTPLPLSSFTLRKGGVSQTVRLSMMNSVSPSLIRLGLVVGNHDYSEFMNGMARAMSRRRVFQVPLLLGKGDIDVS